MNAALTEMSEGVCVAVHVQPRASRNEIVGLRGDELRVRLTSPPVEGAANRLCCEFLADLCGVAKSRVELLSGAKSRHKRLLVRGIDLAEAQRRLAAE
ncbi:DUF167 domain-containing protein [Geoalkalibacter halelectricus]|uniref:UPF0235 protein L9S41_11185 n=1 Tax=Geoalkalibacter halelectricus TaxID=2847045 RepID=A0ABY5ZKJ2_9BACT|nr:DUF167 domain-containing protein [Geoalkalibacter halelectricus]MDO3380167.1 DUF167 domain-containing protein [Geoalkalibacter halelectricus]UWZ78259.1 DUF167 domain-containing protein [Geoalkalibacter halelectricus]